MKRRLALRTERLTDLSAEELVSVAGGVQELPTRRCFTGHYPSIDTPCSALDCVEVVTIQSINSPCPTYAG